MKPGRPFSIVRRVFAMVVGVSVFTVVLNVITLIIFVKPLFNETGLRMYSQLHTIELALRAVPPSQRDALAAAMGSESVSVSRTMPALDEHRDHGLPPPLLEGLQQRAGRPLAARTWRDAQGATQISIDAVVGNETWWVTLQTARPTLSWTLMTIAGSVALIGLAAALTLVLAVRFITRPMSQLADDMHARRNQLRKIDEPPRLSVELQGVIRSFNALVSAVQLSERSRHDLLAGVSHDLRTPLARLRLRAETECPPEVADKMDADFLAVSRIIDQFLVYAQGQNGVAVGSTCGLSALVARVVEPYRGEGVDIECIDTLVDDWPVPDVGMQRLLTNLIDNARAHGRGPIQVELTVEDDELVLMVFDAGPGIPPSSLHDALQPFVRLDTESATDGHCGLGLAIVAQVAGQLGGRAVLRPFDGQRSGVGVSLPA